MKTFLIDDNTPYTYSEFVADLKEDAEINYDTKNFNLYIFYLELIKNLILDREIYFDEDKSQFCLTNKWNNTQDTDFDSYSLDQIIKKVENSTSNIVLCTSGTTGRPKIISHSIQNLMRSVRTGQKYSNNIWGLAYNPSHIAGLFVFFQAFINKCTLINLFQKTRDVTYDQINKFGITNISATPTFYRLLLPFEKEYNSVTSITFGGEKSGSELHNSIKKIFPNAVIHNIYASTEAGQIIVSKGELFCIPDKLNGLVIVEKNEVLIHKSLLGTSEEFEFDEKLYYHTGDIIEWTNENEGLFKFKSRKSELINVGGYKVNPTDVENAIMKIPEVRNVVVYGIKNSILGNFLCCDIELFKDKLIAESTIREYISKELKDYAIPRKINFVDKINLTETGKVRRI